MKPLSKNVYSVAQVNSYIKNMFTQDFMLKSIRVRGEVSNCKYHSSGHIYFTLKDSQGTIACVMFAGNRKGLAFQLHDGVQVVVEGTVDVYVRDGKYQLYAREITHDGEGALYERFALLKKELEEMGMFSPQYKQPIPKYIHTLGVVTAPTGAAVRDIIQIATRRNPYVQIILYPAIVQGEQAMESIIKGIQALTALNVDVMIVGRGGGSIEDLWAFNEESVAQAIFDCPVPIISAVGHETDTTIADYVADLRAPTPSAAAELAVYEWEQLQDYFAELEERLLEKMLYRCSLYQRKIEQLTAALRLASPEGRLRARQQDLLYFEEILDKLIKGKLIQKKHQLALLAERLDACNPLRELAKGYGLITNKEDRTIHSIDEVKQGEELHIHLADGSIQAKVEKIRKEVRQNGRR